LEGHISGDNGLLLNILIDVAVMVAVAIIRRWCAINKHGDNGLYTLYVLLSWWLLLSIGGGAINKNIIYGTYGGMFCLMTSMRTVGL
jgi:hypothetical protein